MKCVRVHEFLDMFGKKICASDLLHVIFMPWSFTKLMGKYMASYVIRSICSVSIHV